MLRPTSARQSAGASRKAASSARIIARVYFPDRCNVRSRTYILHAGGQYLRMGTAPKINILAVEDDQAMRELLRLHLSNAGYVVTLAEDAIAAGHRMLKLPPDLVILDIDL